MTASSPIACGSLDLSKGNCEDPNLREYYHWITYIFIHERYKGEGYGSQLLRSMQYDAWLVTRHPVRADVAHKAVQFFTKNGFNTYGEVWRPMAGSSYFKKLHPMQIEFSDPVKEDPWDTF